MWRTQLPRCLLQDDDPYVRKTAAVCVAKLYDINAELVEDRGFLDTLKVSSRCCCYFYTVDWLQYVACKGQAGCMLDSTIAPAAVKHV